MAGTQTFRPASGIAVTVLMGVVTVATVVALVASGDADAARRILPGFVAATYLTGWVFWWPALSVRPDGVVVRNPLRTFAIGWLTIEDVSTRFSTVIRTPGRAITAWAGPTGRGRPALGTRGRVIEAEAPVVVRIREEAAVAREVGTGDDVVTVSWNIAPIAIAAAVVVTAALLALL